LRAAETQALASACIALSQREYDLLACLMQHAGATFSCDVLLQRVSSDVPVSANHTIDGCALAA
jgi:DNA-binding response OmpR family regulator